MPKYQYLIGYYALGARTLSPVGEPARTEVAYADSWTELAEYCDATVEPGECWRVLRRQASPAEPAPRALSTLDAARVPMGRRTLAEQRQAFAAAIEALAPSLAPLGITLTLGEVE